MNAVVVKIGSKIDFKKPSERGRPKLGTVIDFVDDKVRVSCSNGKIYKINKKWVRGLHNNQK